MKIKSLRIISQKLSFLEFGNRSISKVAIVAGLSLFGVVAAFGIAPDTITQPVEFKPFNSELALPDFSDLSSGDRQSYSYQDKVERGDTVARLLSRLHVDDADALKFLRSDPIARSIFQLKPGRTVQATTNDEGELLSLRYFNQAGSVLSIDRTIDNTFAASDKPLAEVPHLAFKTGTIHSSLFGATDAAGIPDAVASQIGKIFSTDIDFHSDLQRGDQFSVVYEVYQEADSPVRTGKVLAAEFINSGKIYSAIYFETSPGKGDYYTAEGKSMHKAFLRSPLEFSRITSGFTMARFHPILKNWRAHTGVDFAAPTGTKVLATADAVVSFIGKKHGYGNVIELRHQGNYSTLYAHLSGFANRLKQGMTINQGDVIGYVGSTGYATGPHLHYEFKIGGAHQDPLGVKVPMALPLSSQHLIAFRQKTNVLQTQLALIRGNKIAQFE